jgi:hypothetical protein
MELVRDHLASCAILSKFWAYLFYQIDRAMCQLQFVLLRSHFGSIQREESRNQMQTNVGFNPGPLFRVAEAHTHAHTQRNATDLEGYEELQQPHIVHGPAHCLGIF